MEEPGWKLPIILKLTLSLFFNLGQINIRWHLNNQQHSPTILDQCNIINEQKSVLNSEFASFWWPCITTLVTVGLPIVNVPVLSNTIVLTVENLSKILPPRKSSPLVAPSDVPTWICQLIFNWRYK